MNATEGFAALTMVAIILVGFFAMYALGRMHGGSAARLAAMTPVSFSANAPARLCNETGECLHVPRCFRASRCLADTSPVPADREGGR